MSKTAIPSTVVKQCKSSLFSPWNPIDATGCSTFSTEQQLTVSVSRIPTKPQAFVHNIEY